MKIAVIAHVRFPIRAPFKGGMEAHAHGLVTSLAARGHDVRLFAAGDSDPSLPLTSIVSRHYEADMPWATTHGTPRFAAFQREIFSTGWDKVMGWKPDIVHNNSLNADLIGFAARDDMPMLTSLHVPRFSQLGDVIDALADTPHLRFATVSKAQLDSWTPQRHRHFSAVANGVDTDSWRPLGPVSDRAIWIGRITPNKGTGDAARAARLAGMKLDIFGPIEDEAYFAAEVAPFLDDNIVYRGRATAETLQQAVSTARVALVTPCWDEPFGLVAAEALACGVPVAGYANGAIPEVVGDCGMLVEAGDIDGLSRAIIAAQGIDRLDCRTRGLSFGTDAMISGYEALYASAMAPRSSISSTRAELA